MEKNLVIQGRTLLPGDMEKIKELLSRHPKLSRRKLSLELCREWNWVNDKGQVKDIACRSLLRKLESKGRIVLPPCRHKPTLRMKDQRRANIQLSFQSEISTALMLAEALPLTINVVSPKSADGKLFAALLAEHHYLGYKGTVGESLAYLVRDVHGGILGCLLFGAPAWRIAPRDKFIGWSDKQRLSNLKYIVNNMRFLLLNKIPHLASHILGKIAKRISRDWQEKYGHGIVMLETFVEIERFKGTCYRAANWLKVGQTQGRSRNDRYSRLKVPVKDIYCYPLRADYKKVLSL